MFRRFSLLALVLAVSATGVSAQVEKGVDPIKPAASKVVAVTAYQNTALVTREVTLPELPGIHEVVVSPLPPFTLQSSLYAEGSENFRVLDRQRQLSIAQGVELQTLIAYKKSVIDLQKAMYTLLEFNDFEIAKTSSEQVPLLK